MTPPAPRRLLLVAADATPRGTTAAPIRRYRLGRLLMGPEELLPTARRRDDPPQPRA